MIPRPVLQSSVRFEHHSVPVIAKSEVECQVPQTLKSSLINQLNSLCCHVRCFPSPARSTGFGPAGALNASRAFESEPERSVSTFRASVALFPNTAAVMPWTAAPPAPRTARGNTSNELKPFVETNRTSNPPLNVCLPLTHVSVSMYW